MINRLLNMTLIDIYRDICPMVLRRQISKITRKAEIFHYRANMVLYPKKTIIHCPCCGLRFTSFLEGSFKDHPELCDIRRYEKTRQDVICPVCLSLPRHRILAYWACTPTPSGIWAPSTTTSPPSASSA